jgi:hypothetical protein
MRLVVASGIPPEASSGLPFASKIQERVFAKAGKGRQEQASLPGKK